MYATTVEGLSKQLIEFCDKNNLPNLPAETLYYEVLGDEEKRKWIEGYIIACDSLE